MTVDAYNDFYDKLNNVRDSLSHKNMTFLSGDIALEEFFMYYDGPLDGIISHCGKKYFAFSGEESDIKGEHLWWATEIDKGLEEVILIHFRDNKPPDMDELLQDIFIKRLIENIKFYFEEKQIKVIGDKNED